MKYKNQKKKKKKKTFIHMGFFKKKNLVGAEAATWHYI
jgi:hypothetical protein